MEFNISADLLEEFYDFFNKVMIRIRSLSRLKNSKELKNINKLSDYCHNLGLVLGRVEIKQKKEQIKSQKKYIENIIEKEISNNFENVDLLIKYKNLLIRLEKEIKEFIKVENINKF